jgi:DNA-binding beta-propeller fold protein YncE
MRLRLALATVAATWVVAAPASAFQPLVPGECIKNPGAASVGCGLTQVGLNTPFEIAVAPDGRHVYTVANSGSTLTTLHRDPFTGSLTPGACFSRDVVAGCQQAALDEPANVTVSPDGGNVYVLNENNDTLVTFNRNPATGALTEAGCVQDPPATTCAQAQEGLNGAQGIAADAQNVYVASPGDSAVAIFTRGVGGAPVPAGCVEDVGSPAACGASAEGLDGALDVALTHDGDHVYVASFTDDAVVSFDRGGAGALGTTSCVEDLPLDEGCGAATEGLNGADGVAVTPDDEKVFVSASLEDALVRFEHQVGVPLAAPICVGRVAGSGCGALLPLLESPKRPDVGPGGDVFVSTGGADSALVRFDAGLNLHDCVETPPVDQGCASSASTFTAARPVAVSPDGGEVYFPATLGAITTIRNGSPARCGPSTAATAPGVAVVVPLPCSDLDADAVSVEIVTPPSNGSLGAVDQGGPSVTYSPAAGFSGIDSFTYRATSRGRASAPRQAVILVASTTGPPGPPGSPGASGRDAPLVALLAQSRFTVKRGRVLALRFAATRGATVSAVLRKGSSRIARKTTTLAKPGRGTVRLRVPAKFRRKALAPGSYRLVLTATSGGDTATDRAAVRVTR